MKDMYYVQKQARRLLQGIFPDDETGPVAPSYLQGLDEAAFWQGVDALRGLLRRYYTQAVAIPASLDLSLWEVETQYSMSREVREGFPALLEMPGVLFAMGMAGEMDGGVLSVDRAAFLAAMKALRSKHLARHINWLEENGFVFQAWNGKTFDAKAARFVVEYPKNPDILMVLVALGDKLGKYAEKHGSGPALNFMERFVYVESALFLNDGPDLPPRKLEDFLRMLTGEQAQAVRAIVERLAQRGLSLNLDMTYNKNRFHNAKGKDTLAHIELCDYRYANKEDGVLKLRLKLNNPDAYIEKVSALPPHLKQKFTQVKCGDCTENCNRRIIYTLDGERKRACGCWAFEFSEPKVEDLDTLVELYDLEQVARRR